MIELPGTHSISNIHQQVPNSNSASYTAIQRALCEIYGAKATEIAPATPIRSSPLDHAIAFCKRIRGSTTIVDDNSNNHLGARTQGFRRDHSKIMQNLGGDRLISASIVVSYPPDTPRQSQLFFYDNLKRLGWRVYGHLALTNEAGQFFENEAVVDENVRNLIREAAELPDCENVVLMSGDGGMTSAVNYARRAGKKVFVIAWAGTMHPALAAAATDTATIEELKSLIARVLH